MNRFFSHIPFRRGGARGPDGGNAENRIRKQAYIPARRLLPSESPSLLTGSFPAAIYSTLWSRLDRPHPLMHETDWLHCIFCFVPRPDVYAVVLAL
jgi:hypothetical protein